MKQFKKILVGVDLSFGDHAVSKELSAPNAEAVERALWLAQLNSATVVFFYSLELSAKAQVLISESSANETTVLSEAQERLNVLVQDAQKANVKAESHVVLGKSWLEMIRRVLLHQHDLVIVGTRHKGAIQGLLLGSTCIKLLRKCPCAVWVTQSPSGQGCNSILVAHDLRPVGDMAMELGCSMAELQKAQLHVLHSIEYPDLGSKFPESVSEERKQAYRQESESHIQVQLDDADLSHPAQMHFSNELPEIAIMDCIEQNKVDLLVMGTLGHASIPGLITGNTAERLLPRLSCSLLALKPPGFVSPITLQ